MSIPIEFQIFGGIELSPPENVARYRNKHSEPFANIYRGMGTYWVICRSIKDASKYSFSVLGGPNGYAREENRLAHMNDDQPVEMTAHQCAEKLKEEMDKFFK